MWVVEDGRDFFGIKYVTCMFSNLNHLLSCPVVGSVIIIFNMVPLNIQFHVIHSPKSYPLIKGYRKYPKLNSHAMLFGSIALIVVVFP